MRVLGVDFETTGFDTENDKITEVGAVLWDVDKKVPLKIYSDFIRWPSGTHGFPLSDEVKRVTKISDDMLDNYGIEFFTAFEKLEGLAKSADFIVAHNGENFDKPMLRSHVGRVPQEGPFACIDTPWIDTRTDLPFKEEPISRKLIHLALDHGFINPFPHRAVTDVLTMLKVMAAYDFNQILEYRKIPFIVVRALVNYDDRDLAKAQRYMWEAIGDERYPKCWVKKIKENKLEEEKAACNFPLVILK